MKEGSVKTTKKVEFSRVKDEEGVVKAKEGDVKTVEKETKTKCKDLKMSEPSKKKGKEFKPPTKVVVRRLPPTMTEEEFLQQIDPLPPVDFMYYVQADNSLAPNHFCRAYLNFVNQSDIFIFTQKFDNYVFVDSKGVEYPAVVEFAPFQRIPKQRQNKKKDSKCSTLSADPFYISFLEKLETEAQEMLSANNNAKQHFFETTVDSNEGTKVSSTPLLDFLHNRHQERRRLREEKRKKDLERKKAREDMKKAAKKTEDESPSTVKASECKTREKCEDEVVRRNELTVLRKSLGLKVPREPDIPSSSRKTLLSSNNEPFEKSKLQNEEAPQSLRTPKSRSTSDASDSKSRPSDRNTQKILDSIRKSKYSTKNIDEESSALEKAIRNSEFWAKCKENCSVPQKSEPLANVESKVSYKTPANSQIPSQGLSMESREDIRDKTRCISRNDYSNTYSNESSSYLQRRSGSKNILVNVKGCRWNPDSETKLSLPCKRNDKIDRHMNQRNSQWTCETELNSTYRDLLPKNILLKDRACQNSPRNMKMLNHNRSSGDGFELSKNYSSFEQFYEGNHLQKSSGRILCNSKNMVPRNLQYCRVFNSGKKLIERFPSRRYLSGLT